ncbi:MAG: hypothetical protein AB8G99_18090 [Planctomycetaceae bacterium]
MTRSIATFLLLTATALPAIAQCECTCPCGVRYSVFPEVTANRRLPGQWWDDREFHVSAVPANHAYGVVDNSHKPWSLIPGDGYVGSSQNTAPEGDEDTEADDGWEEDTNDAEDTTEMDDSDTDELAPSPRPSVIPDEDENTPSDSDPAYESNENKADGSESKSDDPNTDDFDAAKDSSSFGFDEDNGSNSRSEVMTLPVPAAPDSAGFPQTLFGFAFIALALAGHFVRKTWRLENTIPTPNI